MSIFKSVLVGIDLLQTDSLDSRSFSPPVEEAIKHGLWLAERASASVTFFAAVDVPGNELHPLEAYESHVVSQLERSGRRALDRLVDSARKRGLNAHSRLVSGRAWNEIICEVEQSGHEAGPTHQNLVGNSDLMVSSGNSGGDIGRWDASGRHPRAGEAGHGRRKRGCRGNSEMLRECA